MTLKLVHTFGRNAGLVQTFDKPVVRCGRAPDGDVVFDANYDRDASGQHAEIRRESDTWVVVDLKSRNGTFVDGVRTERQAVKAGSEITFGTKGPRVRVELVDAGSAEIAPMPSFGGPKPERPEGPVRMGASQDVNQLSAGPEGALAPVPGPPAGQRVGQRTLAMLVSSAVAAARGQGQGKMNTRVLSEFVDRKVGDATAGQRRTTAVLAVLLFMALASLVGLVVWSSQSNDEIAGLRGQLAKLPPEDPKRKEIEARLGLLHPHNANFGRNLYDQSKKGIFMLTAGGQGFCTAFAVRPNVLATNAHCVFAARRQMGTVVALENEGRGNISFSVTDMKAHPSYRENDQNALSPDVGIVTINGHVTTVLPLATSQDLTALGAGDDVYLIGFPGRLMDATNPAATFLAAHIGRITNNAGRLGTPAENWLVQHDASTTKGTSGSPIFNGKGKVIAINSGGYMDASDETIGGRKAAVVKASPYKFGMRIDRLNEILR